MPEFETTELSISHLILDPNNYRFHDDPDYMTAAAHRLHEDSVQFRTWRKLKDGGLVELKNSILTNGFIPVEPLAVKRYAYLEDTYLVIEGNRRLAALRWIRSDYESGVDIDQGILEMLEKVPVIIVRHEDDDPAFFEALLGVRHVSGIKEWGGYQRANLVATLKDERKMDTQEIADRIGMVAREVNRRYRAIKALDQMRQDEDYGEHALAELYPLFHEAMAHPVIRDWLGGWDDQTNGFLGEENRRILYEMMCPNDTEESGRKEPKLRTYLDIRELKHILVSEDAKDALLDPRRSFYDALAIAREAQAGRAWTGKVRAAITALEGLGFIELLNLSQDDIAKLRNLSGLAEKVIDSHHTLTSTQQ